MNIFNESQGFRPKKNKFDLSQDKKMSFQMGKLYPMLLEEVLPGDKFRVKSEIMIRLAPMIAPIMHRVNVYTHYFFVPNRILWDEWEDFITGGKDGTSAPVPPYIPVTNANKADFGNKSLADYLGVPDLITGGASMAINLNALPFRGYQTIYNEYYRDQTLSPEIAVTKTGGAVSVGEQGALKSLRNRAWEKDYFTSALPWAQRGPEVTIPGTTINTAYDATTGIPKQTTSIGSDSNGLLEDDTFGKVTLGDGAGNTINDLRRSVKLQEWLERNARGGARYIEQLLSHWGTAPNDARLQRPEYLGGGKQPIVISEVLNTAGAGEGGPVLEPVGEMAGHGISVGANNGFSKTFEEHGFVFGIISVIPRSGYMNGLHKKWSRTDKLDYAWPEFAQIGEQEILNREVFLNGADGVNQTGTFGYTPRYSEYKYGMSTVHGEFKNTLDFWHLGRKFAALPTLSQSFIECTPADTKRVFAVTDTDTDDLYCQIYHDISALRSLPYYGTPSF